VERNPALEAIEGLTRLVSQMPEAGPGGSSPGLERIRGALELYAMLGDGSVALEPMVERLVESEDPLLRGLGGDADFLALLDAKGAGGSPNGVISKEAVGEFLRDAWQDARDVVEGSLDAGDYEKLKQLSLLDSGLGAALLDGLSSEQCADLSGHVGGDRELLEEAPFVQTRPWAYDAGGAVRRAEELSPDDVGQREQIQHILYDSLTGEDYENLKAIFSRDPALGAKILEDLHQTQGRLAKRVAEDSELQKPSEQWSDGFSALMNATLPASRRSLRSEAPPPSMQDARWRLEALGEERSRAQAILDELEVIAHHPGQAEVLFGYPQGTFEPFQEQAQYLHGQLDHLLNGSGGLTGAGASLTHSMLIAAQSGLGAEGAGASMTGALLGSYYQAGDAMRSLQYLINHTIEPFLESLNQAPQPQTVGPPSSEGAGGSGLVPISWSAGPGHETQHFAVANAHDLMGELAVNPQFEAWAEAEWQGLDLMQVAMVMALSLFRHPPQM
jgi:hypothetical protein